MYMKEDYMKNGQLKSAYNQEDDYYICIASKKLLPKGLTTRKSKSNFKSLRSLC